MLKFHTQTSFQTVAFLVQSFTGSSTNRWHPHLLHFLKPITTCEYIVPSGCPGFWQLPGVPNQGCSQRETRGAIPINRRFSGFLREKLAFLGRRTIRFSLPEVCYGLKYAVRPSVCLSRKFGLWKIIYSTFLIRRMAPSTWNFGLNWLRWSENAHFKPIFARRLVAPQP